MVDKKIDIVYRPREEKTENMKYKEEKKKAEKAEILSKIKDFSLQIKSYSSIQSAIVTKGGIDLNEISPSTMRFKKISNLYAVGECIDLDALEGGYNLQIAFSTGHLAGYCLSLE